MSALKLGGITYTYLWALPLEDAVNRLADLGFSHVEIITTPPHCLPRAMDQAARRRMRQLLEARGLTLMALNPPSLDMNVASLNDILREASVQQILDNIELAADLGSRIVITNIGRRHPLIPAPWEYTWDLARPGLERCAELAERLDVILTIENVPSLFGTTGAQCAEAARRLGSDHVKVLYDVANSRPFEDPVEGLKAVGDLLEYVHLSDTDPAKWQHSEVGAGAVDFAAVAEALREMGYTGWSALETIDVDDPDGCLRRSVEKLAPLGWQP
jgi:L-ribulose-5-phosphate 3-epimerase